MHYGLGVGMIEEFQKESKARHKAWREDLISKGYSEADIAQETRKAIEQVKVGDYPEDKMCSLKFVLTPEGRKQALYLLPELRING